MKPGRTATKRQRIALYRPTIWLGHDPGPWIDTKADHAILHNDLSGGIEQIPVAYGYSQASLDHVEKDLHEFLVRLRAWFVAQGICDPEPLIDKIDEGYCISAAFE